MKPEFVIEDGVLIEYNGKRAEVIIPEGVTNISRYCFFGRKLLKKVTIPEGVTEIGSSAFSECVNLKEVALPSTLEVIGDEAFFGCRKLESLELPDGIVSAIESAFYGCDNLKIYAPESFDLTPLFEEEYSEKIEYDVQKLNVKNNVLVKFEGGGEVAVPDGVKTIKDEAFSQSTVTAITLPETLRKIGALAFNNCRFLKSVSFNPNISRIERHAFFNCTSLQNADVPNVGEIEIGTFLKCKSLKEVNIADGVTKINEAAFSKCISLEKVHVPASVNNIANNAFFWSRKVIIYAPARSYAIKYAKKRGIPFVEE